MKNMKRLFTVLLVSLLCVHIASAQTRATRRSEFKIIDPADTVKIQIKKPGVKVRYNSDGKKLNYMSDSLLIVYSPDSVKQHYDPKKEVYYKMEIFGSECDTSFTYTYTNSKIDIKDTTRFSLSFGKDRTEDGAFSRLDFNVPFYSKVVTKSYGHRYKVEPGNFGMALLNVNSGNPDFKTQRSYEVFLNLCTDDFKLSRSVTFNYGLGFSWKNFAMTKNGMMTKDDDGNIRIGGWPEKAEPKVSKLRVFSVTFPLILSVNAYRGVGFSVGPVVNLNASSSIVNKYRLNDEKQKNKYKRAHCNLATVDVMFQLNIRDVGFYAKYSPMNIMDTGYWPEFKHWAIGLTLSL